MVVTAREVKRKPKPQSKKPVSAQPKPNHPNKPASANWIVSPIPFTPSTTTPTTPTTPAKTAKPTQPSDARRKAVDAVVDARVWAAREAAAKRWTDKKRRLLAARTRVRDERRADYVIAQAAIKRHMPLSRNIAKRVALTSGNSKVQLSSNGNARPLTDRIAVTATEYDKDLLTRTVYAEAEHDDEPGRRAVVWTLINRARDPKKRFPMAIGDVCKQSKEFRTLANPKLVAASKALSRHSAAYKEIRQIVDDALAGRSIDPTHGGCFYFYSMK